MIKSGSKVTLHYKLTVDEQVVDSSAGRDPLSYVHGENQIVPGLEEALEGLGAGDKKTAVIPPEKAYGPVNEEAIHKVPREAFKDAAAVNVGDVVTGSAAGQQFEARVAEIGAGEITIDLNHPLAGKTLHFEVEVVGVEG